MSSYGSSYDREEEGNKALISFIIGLLIGGMLIWAFSGPSENITVIENEGTVRAEDVCIEKGGIPIIGDRGNLVDCKKL